MAGSKQRILVVDDEENIRRMLEMLLRKEGYEVALASDGEAALQLVREGEYDTVLCDVRMPKLSGIELLERIQSEEHHTTVIVMSAYGSVDSAIEAMKRGAYDYLSKPFKKDEVLLALKKAEERERLARENRALREATQKTFRFDRIVSRSASMRKIFDTIHKVANYPTTILITGESGTGKELIAHAIHYNSNRKKQPFVAVNCGAIPENLLESELFGHVKGAFTHAVRTKKGLFEEADGGTLFLDEIGELPVNLQVKLLRVLQEGEIRRVGDTHTIRVEVRIIAASVKPLSTLVEEGRFREDLYYRLNVMSLHIPPLRERPEDIGLLVEHFLEKYRESLHSSVRGISPAALRMLTNYPWPGNVRELENTIERAMVLTEGAMIKVEALPEAVQTMATGVGAFLGGDDLSIKRGTRALERMLIGKALQRTKGNRTKAAELLEISHRALLYKIKDYGLGGVS
ncbi:MAG: sigma-54-dependent Fis family transcriptional regulator [Bradymonadales bacterium]|nr:sigma-54-dependent Fis family transcriptional regulator [Bradymonadales bacterium]